MNEVDEIRHTTTLTPVRVGLFGIGLDAYWPQFSGLKDALLAHLAVTADRLARPGVEVVNLGLVDCVDAAFAAGRDFRRADVDLIFLHVTTYALSSTVLPVVRRAKVPVVILNLQPDAAIDYAAFNKLGDRTAMTGHWLSYCAACPVPEIANVFRRAGVAFHQVTGTLDASDPCWQSVEAWIEAARVAHVMAHNRLGVMGHYYGGMLDIYTDLTTHLARFGGHVQMIEVDELTQHCASVTATQTAQKRKQFADHFDVQADCQDSELDRAARTAVALDALVAEHRLGSLAYFAHSAPGHANENVLTSMILGSSLMTASGVPVAGEYEIKNAQAMKILDSLGVGGSFTEYYALDLTDDVVLMGHDGPGHLRIAQGRTKVRPLTVYHGKVGAGLSVEMAVRHGPVTLLSVVEDAAQGLKLLVAQGDSVPGPILEIGNTNSRYRFALGARGFVEAWNRHGPAHHCAVGVGHVADRLECLAAVLGLGYARVC